MPFSVTRLDDKVTIRLPEWLITANRGELRQLALDALEDGARRFTVDLSETTYIDSSGLGALVAVSKRIHEQRGRIRLLHPSEDVRSLLRLTNLESCFDDFDGGPTAA